MKISAVVHPHVSLGGSSGGILGGILAQVFSYGLVWQTPGADLSQNNNNINIHVPDAPLFGSSVSGWVGFLLGRFQRCFRLIDIFCAEFFGFGCSAMCVATFTARRLCSDEQARLAFAGREPSEPQFVFRHGDVTVVDETSGDVVAKCYRGALSASALQKASSVLKPLVAPTQPYETYGLIRNAPSGAQVPKGTRVASYMLGREKGTVRSRFWDDTPNLHGSDGLQEVHRDVAKVHDRIFPLACRDARGHVKHPITNDAAWDCMIVNVLSTDERISNLTAMGVHRDRGDFAKGVSALCAIAGEGGAEFADGAFVLPHYGLGFMLAPGDALFLRAHEHWHGVSKIRHSTKRVTAVLYAAEWQPYDDNMPRK